MESPESLFNAGKFLECSRALTVLLNREGEDSSCEVEKYFYHYKLNKIVADALVSNAPLLYHLHRLL